MASCSGSTMSSTMAIWTALVLLVIFTSWLLLLAFFMINFNGNITSINHIPNSRGELCGNGAINKGRENLLYFDISRCAGLRADNETCRSNQVGACTRFFLPFCESK